MLKKGLSLLLTVIILFSLSGCSEGKNFLLFFVAIGDDSADKDDVFEFVNQLFVALSSLAPNHPNAPKM